LQVPEPLPTKRKLKPIARFSCNRKREDKPTHLAIWPPVRMPLEVDVLGLQAIKASKELNDVLDCGFERQTLEFHGAAFPWQLYAA